MQGASCLTGAGSLSARSSPCSLSSLLSCCWPCPSCSCQCTGACVPVAPPDSRPAIAEDRGNSCSLPPRAGLGGLGLWQSCCWQGLSAFASNQPKLCLDKAEACAMSPSPLLSLLPWKSGIR